MIFPEVVQCPVCGEKDYIDVDLFIGHAICLNCGYDGSMVNQWIPLYPFPPIPATENLTVTVSDLAVVDNSFWYQLSELDSVPTNISTVTSIQNGVVETLTIYHDDMSPPSMLSVTIDGQFIESFMINQEETKVYTLVMNGPHTVLIQLTSELLQ